MGNWHGGIDTPTAAVTDHEDNPEYEVHLGQVVKLDGQPARRVVSFWLQGTRWSGWLTQGDPGDPPNE